MGKTTAGVRGVFNAPTTSADFAHTHSMSVKGGLQSAPTKQYRRLTSQPTGLPRSRPPPVSGSGRPPSASVDVAQVPSLSCPTALRRRVLLGGAVLLASTSLIGTDDAAEAAVATFAAGDFRFLEYEFDQLRYAGVTDVVVGLADDGIQAVQVTYDPERISYVKLLRTYWKNCKPTQAGGQYRDVGPQFVSAVWAQDSAEQAIVAEHIRNLEASGFFGEGQPLMTAVVPRPPLAFTAAAAPARGELKRIRADDPKLYKKLKAERQLYANAHFGFVQFCKDKVCGYVRFAPKCVGPCEDVFPEYRETNFGQPELQGDVKITGGTFM